MRREDMWFKAASTGTEEDINTMASLLTEDPNRFYYNCGTSFFILFILVDSQNRTALYLACADCNLRLVRFLLSRSADPRIAFVIDEKTEETPLGCAIRWGYVEVVSRDGI